MFKMLFILRMCVCRTIPLYVPMFEERVNVFTEIWPLIEEEVIRNELYTKQELDSLRKDVMCRISNANTGKLADCNISVQSEIISNIIIQYIKYIKNSDVSNNIFIRRYLKRIPHELKKYEQRGLITRKNNNIINNAYVTTDISINGRISREIRSPGRGRSFSSGGSVPKLYSNGQSYNIDAGDYILIVYQLY